jgi:hypothetical protein
MNSSSITCALLLLVVASCQWAAPTSASRHRFTLACSPEGTEVTFDGGFYNGVFIVAVNGTVPVLNAHVVCLPGWRTYSWPCSPTTDNVLRWWDPTWHAAVMGALTVGCSIDSPDAQEQTLTFDRPHNVTSEFAGKFVW